MEQNGEDSLASTSNVNIDENQAEESLAEESQDALHLTTDAENTEAENTEAENTENDESRDALGTISHKMSIHNMKFSEMVDRRNINFHPKEFSISSQGPKASICKINLSSLIQIYAAQRIRYYFRIM